MPRAKKYFIPGYLYHITHRCHNRAFLLKEDSWKDRWLHWLARGIRKHGLHVLNYCLTDNHIHLVANPLNSRTVIAGTMHLVAGRIGLEYNRNTSRKGAFWEDRYHATAVQSHRHLLQCLLYVDLNMIRAGVVAHPLEWPYCGFFEMVQPSCDRHIVNRPSLLKATGFSDWQEFMVHYRNTVQEALDKAPPVRDERWTKSLAVGDKDFVEQIKKKLGYRGKYHSSEPASADTGQETMWHLREAGTRYDGEAPMGVSCQSNLIRWEEGGD